MVAGGRSDAAATSIQQFLTRESGAHRYRALRRLAAENRGRAGWLEAWTTFGPDESFHYEIVAEGGSSYIRSRVLRALLDGEKEAIEKGEPGRSALAATNYEFESEGLDPTGLVRIGLVPRRNEGVLVSGAMFLSPADGELVRVEGRLARNPSFWVKHVDIVKIVRAHRRRRAADCARNAGAASHARPGNPAHDLRVHGNRRSTSRHAVTQIFRRT